MAIEIPRDFRRVIIAASVGNVIEWYDFYIFGSLAAVLSVKFFEQSHPVAALLSTIALFTAGYSSGRLQSSPTLGIGVWLAVISVRRPYFGTQVFDGWAWRVPLLVAFLLVAIAVYIRLQLQETPIFEEIKARGQMTRIHWK